MPYWLKKRRSILLVVLEREDERTGNMHAADTTLVAVAVMDVTRSTWCLLAIVCSSCME